MRWKTVVAGLVVAMVVTAGCKQMCFIHECDYNHYRDLGLTPQLENNPSATITPSSANVPKPPTIYDPERSPRYLSLAEAIAMALENGDPGSPALNGTTNDDPGLVAQRSRTVSQASNIRVLSLFPAIVGPDIEASLSKFDARWQSSATWTTTDQPTQGLSSFQNGDQAVVQTGIIKPLPTGGVADITFSTTYTNLTQPPTSSGFSFLNPVYAPKLQFQFEQPLLQGYGVEINQLRATHPGSVLTPFPTGGRVEGILITRIRYDEERIEFERQVQIMLVNVETAYWNLYGSYWTLYSREQAMRQAFEAWKINNARFEAGRIPIQDLSQTRGQYEQFRGQRLQALQQVLDNENQLRAMIGLPVEDGTRLIPIDTPTLAPYEPDWTSSLNEMLALRPGLALARQDLKYWHLELINQRNLLLPDLRFTSTYTPNGQGSKLDGAPSSLTTASGTATPSDVNAFHSLATGKFVNWSLGLRLDWPLGFREAHAQVRQAELGLVQSYWVLRDTENRYTRFLNSQYQALPNTYEQIRAQRAQREAAAITLDRRFKEFTAGRGTIDFLLEAQRLWADALQFEYNAVAQYNSALARFEYAKGTIMQHDNVVISEAGLPQCAQVRAVEHERERSKAIVLRERAKPVTIPCCRFEGGTLLGLPDLPKSTAPAVPSLFQGQAQLPPVPNELPPPPADPAAGKVETSITNSPIPQTTDTVAPVQAPAAASELQKPIPSTPPVSQPTEAVTPAALPDRQPQSAETPPAREGARWNHPEKLQRLKWKQSLGETNSSSP
jgi:outer membrane protein TolC